MFLPTDQDSFIKLALESYDSRSCISSLEIYNDIRNIFRIKKLLKQAEEGKEINVRRLVNYFVILFNQFGQSAIPLILYKIEPQSYRIECYKVIKFLNRWECIWDKNVDINTKSIIESQLINL